MSDRLDIVFLGLSITSSWGNGHATNYRGLLRALAARGHRALFLERDKPWYAAERDLPPDLTDSVALCDSVEELADCFRERVRGADLVVVGSYVPEGVAVGRWVQEQAQGVTAFYDIDTPVTLEKLARGDYEYLEPRLIPGYDLYLSFTGGSALETLEQRYGSPAAHAFYCLVDPERYCPMALERDLDLGYMGTYSSDRQPALERLLLEPAQGWPQGRFAVAGPQYPPDLVWPHNIERIEHLGPDRHAAFYNRQRFTLNVTRRQMVAAGWSPSVRLFEAAACGTPIISDWWEGLDSFFRIGEEIHVARSGAEALRLLRETPEDQRLGMAERARSRVLAEHTAARRVEQLEGWVAEVRRCSPLGAVC